MQRVERHGPERETDADCKDGRLDRGGVCGTHLRRRNTSQPPVLPANTPRRKRFVSMTAALVGDWVGVLGADSESRRWSSSDGKRSAGDFTVVDAPAHGPRDIAELDLRAGLRNLLDHHCEYLEAFPEAGRTAFVELSRTF